MASDWNLMLERLLAAPLTANEWRLAAAIARSTLGYRTRSAGIGERLLQERSNLTDRRGFERARAGLIEAGILRYTPGSVGRGNRSTYELILDPEKARSHARISEPINARSSGTKERAPARARIGRKERTPAANITTKAAEAFLTAGGSLELDEWRGALAQHASRLARRGIPERTILAAAAQLGREHSFPGYLTQRADALEAAGGPCAWDGLDRSRLTVEQLAECDCTRCMEWRSHLLTGATS